MICSILHRPKRRGSHERTKICVTPFTFLPDHFVQVLADPKRTNQPWLPSTRSIFIHFADHYSSSTAIAILVPPRSPIRLILFINASLSDFRSSIDNSLPIMTVD